MHSTAIRLPGLLSLWLTPLAISNGNEFGNEIERRDNIL